MVGLNVGGSASDTLLWATFLTMFTMFATPLLTFQVRYLTNSRICSVPNDFESCVIKCSFKQTVVNNCPKLFKINQ